MPELPEAERARRLAERVLTGRTIRRVRCARDEFVFDEQSPERMRRALAGRTVTGTGRHGKYFWLELDRRPWLLLHFGMTGELRAPAEAPLRLRSSPKALDTDWPPRFTKLHLVLDDGGELVFTNKRRLGRVRLREDPRGTPPLSRMGFDALNEVPSPSEFTRLLAARRAPLKALLLDQGFAAGVGNWIADEVLYQAGLDPRRRACDLDDAEARRVRTKLIHVVRKAVAVDGEKARFPRTWLFHDRWGKVQGAQTARGERIVHETIGGRTTAWVPSRQR